MDRDIVKVVMVVLALLLVLGIFLNKPDIKKESKKYKNEESEVLVADEYTKDVNIDDVLLFDYANLYYQDYSYESDNTLLLNYQETSEELGDKYIVKVFDQNNRELTVKFSSDKSEYIEDDDLYYISYHLQIKLSDNIERFKIVVSRDNAEYSVNCQIDEFNR